jgi:hypothetical protein
MIAKSNVATLIHQDYSLWRYGRQSDETRVLILGLAMHIW